MWRFGVYLLASAEASHVDGVIAHIGELKAHVGDRQVQLGEGHVVAVHEPDAGAPVSGGRPTTLNRNRRAGAVGRSRLKTIERPQE